MIKNRESMQTSTNSENIKLYALGVHNIIHLKAKLFYLTEPWWLSGLSSQSIANSMLKVEGSNPPASIVKLVFSEFSKCMLWTRDNLEFRLHHLY